MFNKDTNRISFLSKKYNVFNADTESVKKILANFEKEGYVNSFLTKHGVFSVMNPELYSNIIGIISQRSSENTKVVSISSDLFSKIVSADPTLNKCYVQWILNVFSNLIKNGNTLSAIRLVVEDLPQAREYITLFDKNKRKNKFITLCNSSIILRDIKDPSDINQYKSLSQLFDAVDPFIERDSSEMEKLLSRYVNSGQAEIPFKDRKFTLYVPKHVNASTIFDKFTNWCTAKEGNGMFSHYTKMLTPFNTNSNLFIIINNEFFNGASMELYQIHFESSQIKDRHNSTNIDIYNSVISKSEGLSKFFSEYLIKHAKKLKSDLDQNYYLKFSLSFGFCDTLFEVLDETTPIIRFIDYKIPKLPNMDRFKNLNQLIMVNTNLTDLDPSVGN